MERKILIKIFDGDANLVRTIELSIESYMRDWSSLLSFCCEGEVDSYFIEAHASNLSDPWLIRSFRRVLNGNEGSKTFFINNDKTNKSGNILLSYIASSFDNEAELTELEQEKLIKSIAQVMSLGSFYSSILIEYFKCIALFYGLYHKTMLFSLQLVFNFTILTPLDYFNYIRREKNSKDKCFPLMKQIHALLFSGRIKEGIKNSEFIHAYNSIAIDRIKVEYDVEPDVVLIVVPQVLSRSHAPTRMLISLLQALKKTKRTSYVINTNDILPDTKASGWVMPIRGNKLAPNLASTEIGLPINRYFQFDSSSLSETIKKLSELLVSIRPESVWTIADNVALESLEIPSKKIMMPTTAHAQFCKPDYYLIRQGSNSDNVKSVISNLKKDVKYLSLRNFLDVNVSPKPTEMVNIKSLVACVVGNRLTYELSAEFLLICDKWCSMGNKIEFFGPIESKDIDLTSYTNLRENSTFNGYVDNLSSKLSHCDVFLNPERLGGGYGARAAIYNHIPVVTLPDNDVAANAGNAFVVSDWNEYLEELIKLTDYNYYNSKRERAKERVEIIEGSGTSLEDIINII
ncbi:hypothetical protein [Idiomarina aquatica]|uniref:Glycosyltransferase involved in cell wall biosynthesis n=1 Tax=Idiomarina aquatica TaxID=1327752 RepID=A0AA94EGH3_9GAMM|nr:hypothetical protein [Idiomarina aquatica]RUO45056.1 hypothetical protein CWE23_03275 [Idiomarina aquatica]